MKRLLSIVSVVAAMLLSTSAFANTGQPKLVGKMEWIGSRQQVMVYRWVYDAKPYALTGEARPADTKKYKLVPQFQDIGARGRITVYRWVPVQ